MVRRVVRTVGSRAMWQRKGAGQGNGHGPNRYTPRTSPVGVLCRNAMASSAVSSHMAERPAVADMCKTNSQPGAIGQKSVREEQKWSTIAHRKLYVKNRGLRAEGEIVSQE